jgi:hypothetical protein
MSPPDPAGPDTRGELFAPLGIILILSGIVVILLAAVTNPLVATAGPFLIASGIGFVVASEYRGEAEMEYSRFGGLRLRSKKRFPPDGERAPAPPSRSHAERRPSNCRLARALSRRRDIDDLGRDEDP